MIKITTTSLIQDIRIEYKDIRIQALDIRPGYCEEYPFVMSLKDNEGETIKEVNISLEILIQNCMHVIRIKDEEYKKFKICCMKW